MVIAQGLSAGEEVVTEGQLRLTPGAKITTSGRGNPGNPSNPEEPGSGGGGQNGRGRRGGQSPPTGSGPGRGSTS
jgi:hypothetical protein